MHIDILTLFPGMFKGPLGESIVKIAQKKKLLKIKIHNLRKWTRDRHKTADDKPYGGGSGMVMKIEPVSRALNDVVKNKRETRIILLTPQGSSLNQSLVRKMAGFKHIVFVCGHYEGVDERIRSLVDEEISIGDYITSCGEMPACVVIDAIARLIPGVLGNPYSVVDESFEKDLLEYPQYTRPREFEGMAVPEVLLSGDHANIQEWRRKEAIKRTGARRPDLLRRRSK